ncbi:MAG: hypothetical protein ACI9S8_000918 [Chlamydiales bacterium]|jgi:hypothetical protein
MNKLYFLLITLISLSFGNAEAYIGGQHTKKYTGVGVNAVVLRAQGQIWLNNGSTYMPDLHGQMKIKRWKSGDPLAISYQGRNLYSMYNVRTREVVYAVGEGGYMSSSTKKSIFAW